MGRIEGDARTVRELLDNAHYTIDVGFEWNWFGSNY